MYLIFDTETTGFPKKDYKDADNARVTQLAWALFNKEGKCFKKSQAYILPDGWEIPSVESFLRDGKTQEEAQKRAQFFIDNGHSQERNLKHGKPMPQVLKHFIDAVEECDYLIAHNMNFDQLMMLIEMHKYEMFPFHKPIKICTMQSTTDLLKIPSKTGYKWPKLIELYTWLFGKSFEGAHDANFDVEACAECFFELKKRGLINLPEN